MAAEMKRGANVELTREIPGLSGVVLGISWNANNERVLDENLVYAAILCDTSSRALSDEHLVFFNQVTSPDRSVTELEQVLGADHEQIEIDLAKVPADVARVVLVLYVNDGPTARRTLGQLKDLRLRVLDASNDKELVRSENFALALNSETAVSLGEVYRYGTGWKFKVIGQGYAKGFRGVADDYGLRL